MIDQKSFLEDMNMKLRKRLDCAQVRQVADEERMTALIAEMNALRLASVDAEKASLDRVLEQLRLQVSDLQTRCSLQQDDP
ncbi:hypothetical protein PHET_09024 [Paragonimus heterotremus]|uniref:Uncharacterized protein n=1 Tax=Paragonimus heterotremus TaxID=100268 RepID=A0A8J4WUG7_9TREM|nr:hypothetical protein PHET_09024 [Paragonimus heterotremus]